MASDQPWAARRSGHDCGPPRSGGSRALGPTGQHGVQRAVANAKQGDPEAIRFLYTTFGGTVRRYVARMLGETDADDVTQNVFLRLMTRIGSYERRDVPFEGWLLHMAHNVAIDELRRRRTDTMVHDLAFDALAHDVPAPSVGDHALRSALDTLPRSQREVAVLRLVVGLSSAETARVTRRTEASINNLHYRARIALQEALLALGAAPGATTNRAAPAQRRRMEALQGSPRPKCHDLVAAA
jgi:RNA polymerase sigma-70 factor, ECF subfamily